MERFIILQDLKDNTETYTNEKWDIVLKSKDVAVPVPKTNYLDITGADGTLDLTEAITGETKYKNRTIKYNFTLKDKFVDLPAKISDISSFINGKRFKVYNWDDLDYYYIGRLAVNNYKVSKATGTFTIEATCDPYKYKRNITSYTYEIAGTETITCSNERKRVVPKITIDSEMTIEFKGNTYAFSKGTYEVLNIYFDAGSYDLKVTGNGTITIEYQEACL